MGMCNSKTELVQLHPNMLQGKSSCNENIGVNCTSQITTLRQRFN